MLERQQHWLTCSQYLPTDAGTHGRRGGRRNADCQLDHAASGCSPGVLLSLLRHVATMDTLAALCWSICATGAGAASHVQAPARLVAQHQYPAQRRTVLALLRHTLICRTAWHLIQSCWRRAVALGRWSRGSRHRGQQRARGGESKERHKESLRDNVIHPNLVVDPDSDVKNRCSPSRFREIAIANLSLHGGVLRRRGTPCPSAQTLAAKLRVTFWA